jgi:hypothetical protein
MYIQETTRMAGIGRPGEVEKYQKTSKKGSEEPVEGL